ncbi:MAG TPA: tetratricopeptide repeat protein, partial [Pirellulaceae bacterium]|nr:tetratricopeptide repeat protein [Pirellulaceae bacterium]
MPVAEPSTRDGEALLRQARRTVARRCLIYFVCLSLLLGVVRHVGSQDAEPNPSQRPTVSINIADNATMAHLARFDALLAEQQWQEAVESIRQDTEASSGQLVLVTPNTDNFRRYVPLSTYRQMKLAELAVRSPDALALYRRQVDPVANKLLTFAREQRDEASLRQIVTKYFASSHADDALLELGEIALERGNWTEARGYWEQISPLTRFPTHEDPKFREFAGQPRWLITQNLRADEDWDRTLPLLQTCDKATSWPVYRDTNIELPNVYARLTLVSILECNRPRATAEIELIQRLCPDATGEIGGRSGKYVELLQAIFEESQSWPALPQDDSWPTFAGSNERKRIAASLPDLGSLKTPRSWQLALPTFSGEGELIGSEGSRVAGSSNELLSYHPIVIGDAVIIQAGPSESDVVARRIEDGSVVFGVEEVPTGIVASPGLKRSVGVPRFPLSSYGKTVYARVGSLPTGVNVNLRQEREAPARII